MDHLVSLGAGQGRAGRGRAGQGGAGQGRVVFTGSCALPLRGCVAATAASEWHACCDKPPPARPPAALPLHPPPFCPAGTSLPCWACLARLLLLRPSTPLGGRAGQRLASQGAGRPWNAPFGLSTFHAAGACCRLLPCLQGGPAGPGRPAARAADGHGKRLLLFQRAGPHRWASCGLRCQLTSARQADCQALRLSCPQLPELPELE